MMRDARSDGASSMSTFQEINTLYTRVRKSHTLFEFGLVDQQQSILSMQGAQKYCQCMARWKAPQKSADTESENVFAKNMRKMNKVGSSKEKLRRQSSRRFRGRSTNTYKVRNNRFARSWDKIANNRIYKMISMMVSIGALYARDIEYAFVPKTGDFWVLNVLLTTIMLFLFAEFTLHSVTHSDYCFTFFFWLDLIGTVSILIDIPWIVVGFGLNNNIFLIVKGGRMGRAARGVGSVRFIKLIKMVRMVKLFRIINIFRKKTDSKKHSNQMDISVMAQQDNNDEENDTEIKPTKMGSMLADKVTQKIILGVLLSFLLLPLFDVGDVDQGDKTFIGLADLEYIYSNHHNASTGEITATHLADYQHSLARFESYHSNILYLQIGSTGENDAFVRVETDEEHDELRPEEVATFISASGASKTALDVSSAVQEEAILNICLTTFIMIIFAVGSFVISVDSYMLVYPLEYLVIVLKRLSSIAVHMYHENMRLHRDNPEIMQQHEPQMELFRTIMRAMTDVFYSGKRDKMFIDSLEIMESVEEEQEEEDVDTADDDGEMEKAEEKGEGNKIEIEM